MKRTILYVIGFVLASACYGQNISINAQVVDEKIPEEAARQLETKLQSALTANGYADNGYIERFVLTAKVDITQKDITPTTPSRISEKMDITLMVGDVVENKIYATVTLQSAGIGINENKAFISAFCNIMGDNPKIQQMLSEAKEKIMDYYTIHCSEIVQCANSLTAVQKYDEAIALLVAVPNVCNDCFSQCQQEAGKVYQQKIDAEATVLLEQAQAAWTSSQNASGASKVADIISNINSKCSIYTNVVALRNAVESELQADAKREWNFKMQQYEDNQQLKRSLVDAAKAVGVAWAKKQPTTVYKTVIHSWW